MKCSFVRRCVGPLCSSGTGVDQIKGKKMEEKKKQFRNQKGERERERERQSRSDSEQITDFYIVASQ